MSKIELPYIHCFTDIRGKERCYYNRAGWRKVALPLPNAKDFMKEYLEASSDENKSKSKATIQIKKRSFAALIQSYKKSGAYKFLKKDTTNTYNLFLRKLEAAFGHLPVKSITAKKINAIRNTKKHAPDQANRLLSILRLLFRHAIEEGWIEENPTTHIENLRTAKKKGFPTWSDNDIQKFIDRWPLGTKEYLALQCILQTSQRRSDIVGFSFEMIENGAISLAQSKTGVELTIPVLPDLVEALELLPYSSGPILRTSAGKHYKAAGFGNFFRKAVYAANLKGLAAHGLRKAMCTRLANAGCSPSEIQAVSGHLTLSEVSRYTQQANKKLLAKEATDKLLKK